MNFEVTDFSATAQFPFALTAALPGGGELRLQGKCSPISAGNTGATPFQAAMTIRNPTWRPGLRPSFHRNSGVADFEGGISSDGKQATASGTLKTAR